MTVRAAVFLAVVCTLAVARAVAAAPLEVISGWEGDTNKQGYGFVTMGASFPVGPATELPVRVSGSYLYYRYDSTGTTQTVRSPGASAMTGVRFAVPGGSITLLGGAEVRREHRAFERAPGPPPVPAPPSRDETVTGVVAQVEGDLPLAPRWRTFLLGNYGGASRYSYGRAALRWQATNPDWQRPVTMILGVEGVGQGNDESAGFQAGGLVEWAVGPHRLSLSLHAGYKETWSPGAAHQRGPYAGAGVYHRF